MLTLTMFSVLTRCLGFLYKIYLSRVVTTTELGIYSLTTSIYMVIITLVGSSTPLTISKITSNNIALNKNDKTKFSVTSSLILSIILSFIICVLIILCKPLLILMIGSELGYTIMLTLIPSILFTAIYSQIRGYLWGIENYFAVSMVELIEQILRIVCCMIFITISLNQFNSISVGLSLSIACAISTIYGIFLYFKNGGKFKYNKGYFKEIIHSAIPLTGVRLFGSLLQPIVAIILPLMLSNLGMLKSEALSELGIVMGMSMPLLSIPSTIIGSLCMILIPKISSNSNNNQSINLQISAYIKFTITCIFIFIPIFIVLGEPICNLVFNNSSAGIYMSYCAWTTIPLGIAQITTSILNALNQEKKTFYYFVISSLFMLISVFILPKFLGIQTMLVANGISGTILSILNIIQIKKITNFKSGIAFNILNHSLVAIPVILLITLTYNWLNSILSPLFTISICSIVALVSYISLLFAFNIFDFTIIKGYINKFSKKNAKV